MPLDDLVNAEYLAMIMAKGQVVLSCEIFAGVESARPLAIKEGDNAGGGYRAPFEVGLYKVAMASEGLYEASGNWWWQDYRCTTAKDVPVNLNVVLGLKK
jgi:hypothetical protein